MAQKRAFLRAFARVDSFGWCWYRGRYFAFEIEVSKKLCSMHAPSVPVQVVWRSDKDCRVGRGFPSFNVWCFTLGLGLIMDSMFYLYLFPLLAEMVS